MVNDNPHLQIDPSIDSRNHELNKGRELLFDLEVGKRYLIEATLVAKYDTHKDSNIRLTFEEVIVKPYTTDQRYEEIPMVAMATHLNTVRKKQGLEHVRLEEGQRHVWVGQLEVYSSSRYPGVERRSFKVMRDVGAHSEIKAIEKRIRNVWSLWESLKIEEIKLRQQKTRKMLSRMTNISTEFFFVPHITKAELDQRIENCLLALSLVDRKVKLLEEALAEVEGTETLDEALDSLIDSLR